MDGRKDGVGSTNIYYLSIGNGPIMDLNVARSLIDIIEG